jgi:hypothetical protein
MALGNCTNEVQDCNLENFTDSMILRKLLRKDGNCFYLNTGNANISSLITEYSANAATRALIVTAFDSFKTANPTANILFKQYVWNGTSYDLFVSYK